MIFILFAVCAKQAAPLLLLSRPWEQNLTNDTEQRELLISVSWNCKEARRNRNCVHVRDSFCYRLLEAAPRNSNQRSSSQVSALLDGL